MELESIEKEGRVLLDVKQNHTVANLTRKALWETGAEAAYDKGHPLGDESNLIVESENPKEDLEEAIEVAKGWLDEVGI